MGFLCHCVVWSVFPVSFFYDWETLGYLSRGVSIVNKELAGRLRDHLFPQKEKFHSEAPTSTSLRKFIQFLYINNNNNNNNSNNRVLTGTNS